MPAIASQLLHGGGDQRARSHGAHKSGFECPEANRGRKIPGPTLYVSGALLEHQPRAGTEAWRMGVSGPDDARAKVNRLADKGVNLIKLLCMPDMTQEEANAVVDQAHKRGLIVAAHGRTDDEVRKCLTAGVDDFQHLAPNAIFPDDIVEMIRKRVATRILYWTPTIGPGCLQAFLDTGNYEILDDPAWQRGLTPAMIADIQVSLLGWMLF